MLCYGKLFQRNSGILSERLEAHVTDLLEWKFDSLLLARNEFVPFDDSRARVPTQQRIVVVRRTDCLCLFEPAHRLAKKIVSLKPAIRYALSQLGFGAALVENPCVISPFVLARDAR